MEITDDGITDEVIQAIAEKMECEPADIHPVNIEYTPASNISQADLWTVELQEVTVFLWKFPHKEVQVFHTQFTRTGYCYPLSSCVTCIDLSEKDVPLIGR